MAQGKTATATITKNNMIASTVSKTVEQIVVNGALANDPSELNPGVNSRFA